jgi:Zn-dependent protease
MLSSLLSGKVDPIVILLIIIAVLVGITIHEFAHAWTANYLGDDTAKLSGRLTLNPIMHLDPIGGLMLLLVGFGWAKPVPINPSRFKSPMYGEILVSIAGPISNFLVAVIFSIIFKFIPAGKELFKLLVYFIISINIGLGLFNLLPVPPLDGSHLLTTFLIYRGKSTRILEIIQTYGIFFLFAIIFFAADIIEPVRNFFLHLLGVAL